MVTWSFDFAALVAGVAIGMIIGALIGVITFCAAEMRDGGAWDKGFFEGCEAKFLINYLNREKEEAKERRRAEPWTI